MMEAFAFTETTAVDPDCTTTWSVAEGSEEHLFDAGADDDEASMMQDREHDELSFAAMVRAYIRAGAQRREVLRDDLVSQLACGENQGALLDWLIVGCLREPVEGRVDGIIDVVAPAMARGLDLKSYLIERNGSMNLPADAQYALVCAAGKQINAWSRVFVFNAANSASPALREGAVAALANFADPTSVAALRRMAESDASSVVRRIAQEALTDLD
jgi:hypothetical protein